MRAGAYFCTQIAYIAFSSSTESIRPISLNIILISTLVKGRARITDCHFQRGLVELNFLEHRQGVPPG